MACKATCMCGCNQRECRCKDVDLRKIPRQPERFIRYCPIDGTLFDPRCYYCREYRKHAPEDTREGEG